MHGISKYFYRLNARHLLSLIFLKAFYAPWQFNNFCLFFKIFGENYVGTGPRHVSPVGKAEFCKRKILQADVHHVSAKNSARIYKHGHPIDVRIFLYPTQEALGAGLHFF